MKTLELKHIITEHLSHIEDERFLNALKTIIETKVSKDVYKLNDFQKERVDSARQDLMNVSTISHEDLQLQIDQWLNTK